MDFIQKLEIAFQASPGPVVLVNPSGRIELANGALETLFEYAPGELIGQQVEVLVPAAAREHHPDLREAYFEVPSNRAMGTGRDLHGVSKSGRSIPVEIGLNHLASDSGNWVLASILDITERKKEQEKLRMAVDAASSAMIMTTDEGLIVLTNAQASAAFGYTSEEMLGQRVEMLIPQGMRRRHVVYRTSFASAPTRREMGAGRELFGLRKDGTEFPLEIGLTPFASHDGNYIMATVIDITERRQIQLEISGKNAELERLNAELTNFAYSASHDLKSPLSTIQGLLKFAERDLESGHLDEVKDNIGRCRDLSAKLAVLVEDVLDLARADHSRESPAEVDLKGAVAESLLGLDGLIAAAGVDVRVDVPEALTITVERTRLAQILDNLIGNAVKYNDPAKPTCYAAVAGQESAHHVELTVADNGVGIPQSCHGEVFKMFKRFGDHASQGSGLGLALVKKAVDRLGGTIRFESSPDGTCFTVAIPKHQGGSA